MSRSTEWKLMHALFGRFLRDERGSAMTEFIIILPVFVTVFAGVVHLRTLNATATQVGATAYADMWDQAIAVQVDDPGIHSSPGPSGNAISMNLQTYAARQQERGPRSIVKYETGRMANELGDNGHMGESYARVSRVRQDVELRYIDGDLTNDVRGVTGESRYGELLFNDGNGAGVYSAHHGGPLGSLDRLIDGPGLRPVLAAGNRYGSVIGQKKEKVTVAGRDFEMARYYTTLVAPHWRSEAQATAVTRTAMDGIDAYDNLLGIAERQPLRRESIEVRPIDGAFQ